MGNIPKGTKIQVTRGDHAGKFGEVEHDAAGSKAMAAVHASKAAAHTSAATKAAAKK